MLRYLLDTCVISETNKPIRNRDVVQFLQDHSTVSSLSVITLGEALFGIARLDEGERKKNLQQWLQTLQSRFAEAILPIDVDIIKYWAEMRAISARKGKTLAVMDALIAATAKRHGLTIVTRNVTDFKYTGVSVHNPWK